LLDYPTGIIFVAKGQPFKPFFMHIETTGKDLPALLELYNKEIDTLKSKLLNGIPWENLVNVRRNITELAIAIHKLHNYKVESKTHLVKEVSKEESAVAE
jgi:hypothetical protein